MSNNLIITPHLALLKYSGQLPYPCKNIRSSSLRGTNNMSLSQLRTEGIRTSQKLIIFYSKLFKEMMMGGVAKYPKRAEGSKHAEGKPQLNRYFPKMPSILLGAAQEGIRTSQKLTIFYSKVFTYLSEKATAGGVELESNLSRSAVSLRNLCLFCVSLTFRTLIIK